MVVERFRRQLIRTIAAGRPATGEPRGSIFRGVDDRRDLDGRSNESGANDAEGPARESRVSLRHDLCVMVGAIDSESIMMAKLGNDNGCTIVRRQYGSVLVSRVHVVVSRGMRRRNDSHCRRDLRGRYTILTDADEKHCAQGDAVVPVRSLATE